MTVQRPGTEGFSLLEALVALALTAIVVGALGMVTQNWLPTWMHGLARLQESNDVAIAVERLTSDISEAEFVPRSLGTRDPLFHGQPSVLTLVRRSIGPNNPGGLELVRWAAIKDGDLYRLSRSRADYSPSQQDQSRQVFSTPTPVLRSRYSLNLAYAGDGLAWQPVWEGHTDLPRQVRMTLSSAGGRFTVTSSVPLRVPLECLASKAIEGCFPPNLPTQGAAVR
jgi:general secretion pathway protein J